MHFQSTLCDMEDRARQATAGLHWNFLCHESSLRTQGIHINQVRNHQWDHMLGRQLGRARVSEFVWDHVSPADKTGIHRCPYYFRAKVKID